MRHVRTESLLKIFSYFLILTFSITFCYCGDPNDEYKIIVINGGKEIERENFLNIFDSMENVKYREVIQPEANNIYNSDEVKGIDAIVFYDFVQDINEAQKEAFIELLNKGKGIVFLHHSLVSYQDWDEFEKIIGGRYYQSTNKADSMKYVQSTYQHDVDIPVQIVDKNHPITKGIENFVIHDEVYGKFNILDEVTPLLTTTHPLSEKVIGWTHKYGKSRIAYIQLGHDHHSFEDNNYRRLIKQAIEWAAE